MTEKDYYSIAELARIIGVSRIAIYNKVRAGKIEAKKVGRMFVIPKSEIESVLGTSISEKQKRVIDAGVRKTIKEYSITLKKLGSE